MHFWTAQEIAFWIVTQGKVLRTLFGRHGGADEASAASCEIVRHTVLSIG